MQTDLLPKDQSTLIIRSEPVELVLSEDGVARLALILPPFEDLREIEHLSGKHFSLKEHADKEWEPFKAAFAVELSLLEKKKERFAGSRTYFTHLANLAELAGNRQEEFRVLIDAQSSVADSFFKHRLGENLQASGRIKEAEDLFSSFDLNSDAPANLRVAYFHAQRNSLDLAAEYVSRVLAIDPLSYGGRLFEGALRLARGQYQDAIQSFRIAEGERPTSSVLFTNLAIAYIFIKRNDKALASLRKAVALDPLNQNAVTLLADVAHVERRDEDAVPALRYFVNLEQKIPSVWGRLARSLLQLKRPDEALLALRRQASLEDTSAVWNNLGVAHISGGNRKGALSAFKHSMTKVSTESIGDAFLALRNILSMLVEERNFEAAVRMAKLGILEDRGSLIKRDKKLVDIYAFLVYSLRQLNKVETATKICEELLEDQSISATLRIWIVAQLLSHYSIAPNLTGKALALARNSKPLLDSSVGVNRPLLELLTNNLAFAFAEAGLTDEANSLMPYLGKLTHKQAYPTATLGLIHLRKGHLEKGTQLYEEAIRLAVKAEDKTRIRQKLNLELGIYLLQSDEERAKRLLKKAADERDGSPELMQKANRLLRSVRHIHN